MSRRVTAAFGLSALLISLMAIIGVASVDDAPDVDPDRFAAFVDAPDFGTEPDVTVAMLVVAVLGGIGLLWSGGLHTVVSTTRPSLLLSLAPRSQPARAPPTS